MANSMTLRIEVKASDASIFDPLVAQAQEAVTLLRAKHFDGPPDLVQALILLSPVLVTKLLPTIAEIVGKQLETKHHVSLEYNNLKITNITADNAERMLQAVLKHDHPIKGQS